jgi:uncharacterized membrane protein YidH (DUF202 family)
MSSSRKRAARPDNNPFSTDESAPIIQHAQGGAKDYSSISPSISARTNSVGHTNGNSSGLVGTTGTTRSMQWESREHSATQREEAERHAAEQERRESSKWRKFLDKYGSVELENKGSVARDHLALGKYTHIHNLLNCSPTQLTRLSSRGTLANIWVERTFLAWLRTSLSFASIGIAITQLFRLNTAISNPPPNNTSNSSSPSIDSETPQVRLRHVGKPLGATFIAISILILCIGFHRYFEAQHYVIRGKFPASRGSIMLVSAVAGGLIISSLVVILAIAPRAFEN